MRPSVTVIQKEAVGWRAVLRELWEYRYLLWVLVRRDFVAVYKQTILGPLWYVLQPLASTVVFTLIFGRLTSIGTDGAPDYLFYMAGSILWAWTQAAFANAAGSLLTHAHIVTKVYFPRLILPLAAWTAALAQLALNAGLLWLVLGGARWRGVEGFRLLAEPRWLPVSFLIVGAAVLGAGLWMAALTARYRDLRFAMPFFTQLWMFLSPIVWPLSRVAPAHRAWLALNPLAAPIELWRRAWLGVGVWSVSLTLTNAAMAVLWLVSGAWVFRRAERTLADVA
jgi:lipopolysaccharide transport system permease protein